MGLRFDDRLEAEGVACLLLQTEKPGNARLIAFHLPPAQRANQEGIGSG